MSTTGTDERVSADRHLLEDLVRAALRRSAEDGWDVRHRPPWTYVALRQAGTRDQGWKLHVSATPLSAPVVLARAAEVLVRHRCPFKFAATFADLTGLLSRNVHRGSAGKFITVYPPDDEAAAAIAEDLHRATYGLPGPPVLSDRAYRPDSLVHYRYGVFSARSVLDNDGVYSSPLTAPDGACLVDRRNAWYSPPEWAACPFESGRAPVRTAAPEAVELAGRFVVRQAIRHGAKGGVFLAEDRLSGAQVVIKQARPHISATLQGQDERDRLRHEADMLDLFGPLGVTSRKVALFTQGDNVFLAQEHLDGAVLTAWAEQARAADPDGWPHVALTAVRALTGLVAAVHERGFVLRDLTPNNVIAGPDGSCRLVDLEMAAVPGTPVTKAYTAGYAPPEQVRGPMYGPAAGAAADLYALGATVLHLATACRPLLGSDDPSAGRSWDTRVRGLVEVATEGDAVASALRPMILGLMRENPARRWDLRRVGAFLDDLGPLPAAAPDTTPRDATAAGRGTTAAGQGATAAGVGRRLSVAGQERLLRDGIAHTLRRMDRDPGARRLWPVSGFGETADPCAVQYGSAGVLALLASVLNTSDLDTPNLVTPNLGTADLGTQVLGTGEVGRGEVAAALRHGAAWTLRRLGSEARPSPGLHFGRAGIAWGLYEAGRALGDDALRTTGTDLALTLPTSWPNPDVCHGLAGTGLALLHLWRATGDERFRERAAHCADALLASAERTPGAVLWPIPERFPSALAGAVHYGFAHGVAGIGTFLLSAAAPGGDEYLETALLAGRTLLAAAQRTGAAAWWPEFPGGGVRMTHWCSGSSGVGSFLLRLHSVTGEPDFLDAAKAAAVAVRGSRLSSGTAACHGLAGDGQFLLDMAGLLGDEDYRAQAAELAACLEARAVLRDGLLVVPDENGDTVSFGWNTGLAGVLDFLLRLRHGGPRPWTADVPAPEPALEPAPAPAPAGS
ncbi:class IV lanthionine synthetase LanL [Nonomuraea sp. NPDC050227]|uniref:class IV lanthionine synthetase LanL n=1 Tax=Nonomuraea sp. NPDC050227 TaxID=3364360 RepID=UPI00379E817E